VSGYATEAATILGRLKTEWDDTTPIAWPNVDFTPPATAWIRPTLLASDAARREMGATGTRTFRHHGLLLVQVFTPEGSGDGSARTYAEQVCGIFRGVQAGGITYEGPTGEAPTARGDGRDGNGWYMWTVTVPYTRDELY
jgi:hypothetical protein